jgi:VanZ family protein
VLPLRYPLVWSALGWLLVLGVIVGSLAPGNSLPTFFSFHDKVLHFAAYFVLTLWFTGLYRRALYLAVAAVLFGLGVALDMLQGLTATRSLDWYDVAADLLGISAGLAISISYLGGWCQRLEERLLS